MPRIVDSRIFTFEIDSNWRALVFQSTVEMYFVSIHYVNACWGSSRTWNRIFTRSWRIFLKNYVFVKRSHVTTNWIGNLHFLVAPTLLVNPNRIFFSSTILLFGFFFFVETNYFPRLWMAMENVKIRHKYSWGHFCIGFLCQDRLFLFHTFANLQPNSCWMFSFVALKDEPSKMVFSSLTIFKDVINYERRDPVRKLFVLDILGVDKLMSLSLPFWSFYIWRRFTFCQLVLSGGSNFCISCIPFVLPRLVLLVTSNFVYERMRRE